MKLVKITIDNFRGIKHQEISDIQDSLVLIGKNNAGKSAVLTAIRALRGEYSIEEKDFHKDNNEIKIAATFLLSDKDLRDFFTNPKLGYTKLPSSSTAYENVKQGTIWEDKKYSDFNSDRKATCDDGLSSDIQTISDFEPIWLNALRQYLAIDNNTISLELTCKKEKMKTEYSNKDILAILPEIAFIDDTRNFGEEEVGKSRSITAKIFERLINTELLGGTMGRRCEGCTLNDCFEECIEEIQAKNVEELTIEELQKLVNFKTKNSASTITSKISEKFKENYRNDFGVNIRATSSINKSFSLATKLYDPSLDSELDLSNVGAGVRSIYILSLLQAYQEIKSEGQSTIFIIEEPELYLHPELQKSMAKTLYEISQNSQVFFSTHSPIMLREFQSDDIRQVHLDELEYNTIIQSTTIGEILNEIGYSSQDILNTDFVLFVEGQDDKRVLNPLLSKYYNLNNERVQIIDTRSCKNIQFYATLRFLEKTTMSNEFAIIRDSDTADRLCVLEGIKNRIVSNSSITFFNSIANRIFITRYSAMEGYLFSPELLVEHSAETGFHSVADVYVALKNKIRERIPQATTYFRDRNRNNQQRVEEFERMLPQILTAEEMDIEWVKRNLRGHNYFDAVRSGCISIDEYVEKLPREAFADILDFLDSIEFFRDRKI